ncbi:NAD+ synthase [Jatrophihabitans endophyticus]|uniref:NAD+ synthase n=1 Tax=Jatrophihabitans endophyticus TaxID=1206085 RepID=UPI0019E997E5|nr:NAD+ synthase [Jatrophihabitans endophyticus]MBE7188778.1 NAD+ synthase [Jatrophihabitans endophyticus]
MIALRLGLAQVNYTVGDLGGNTETVLARARQAVDAGAQLVMFPEMMLTGYPVEDLVLRPTFRDASRAALDELAVRLDDAGLGRTAVVVGYIDDDGRPRNASAFLLGGRVVARYFKHHLPNYGVFDERRYFAPGTDLTVVRHLGVDIALTVCEDVWQDGGPFTVAGRAGVGLVLNINSSPYERHKDDLRLPLLQRRSAEAGAPIAYVNSVAGQDELVFDGDSMVVEPDGRVVFRAPQFVEDVYVVDVPVAEAVDPAPEVTGEVMTVSRFATGVPPAPAHEPEPAPVAPRIGDEEETWLALVLGLRDYVAKNGFRSVVLGVSGGIDSAVVAAVAAEAVGGDNVYGVSLPSAYSSEHSRTDAEDLMQRLGGHFRTLPIKSIVDDYVSELSLTGVAEENVQARIRGTLLMALSNTDGHLVLATGNKSELAVGYATIYDAGSIGGFAPLKDVPKTLVWALARWRNARAAERGRTLPIPPNSIEKPPSAELSPGQLDSDSLPDYDLLDSILTRYVDADRGVEQIVDDGFDRELVHRIARMVDAAEWKRRQYPPGTKVSFKAFGRDRRLPITNRWREN